MVTDSGYAKYAQAGYIKYSNTSCCAPFGEYWDSVNCPNSFCNKELLILDYASNNYQYYEAYNSSNHAIGMFLYQPGVGVTLIGYTDYDPANPSQTHPELYWGQHWKAQYNGESHNWQDDVPGTSSAKASFTSDAYETGSQQWNGIGNPSYTNQNDNPTPSSSTDRSGHSVGPTYYCGGIANSNAFNIWTSGTC
jgi:hypothetical protein